MAIQGVKFSDLTTVQSVSGCSLIPLVQNGSTVNAKLSSLGFSLNEFNNIKAENINAEGYICADNNIITNNNIIANGFINSYGSLSSRSDACILGSLNVDTNILSGNQNLSDIFLTNESDTLDDVLFRGNSSNRTICVGGATINGNTCIIGTGSLFSRGSICTCCNFISAGVNLNDIFAPANVPTTLQQVTDNGNTSTNEISTNNNICALEFSYGGLERPSLTGLKAAVDDLLYLEPEITSFTIDGSSSLSYEVGRCLATPSLEWCNNKVDKQAICTNSIMLPNGDITTGGYTFSSFNDTNSYRITSLPGTNTIETSTWTVNISDWKGNSNTDNLTTTFRYGVFYGSITISNPANITNQQVLDNVGIKVLSQNNTGLGSKTINVAAGQYIYVAYPTRFGTTTKLRIDGFDNTNIGVKTISNFANTYNGVADYYVYYTNSQQSAGSKSITIL